MVLSRDVQGILAMTNGFWLKGDDNVYYLFRITLDDAGLPVLTRTDVSTTVPEKTRNFSGRLLGIAFYLYGDDNLYHRFQMVWDGIGTATYGLSDQAQTSTVPFPVLYTVSTARFDDGLYMADSSGAQIHKISVASGELAETAQGYTIPL